MRLTHLVLDLRDDLLRFVRAPVGQEPPRALRDEAANRQDRQGENRADGEAEAPADRRANVLEQLVREESRERGPEPPAAVDRERDPAADARRDQLVDRGVDRRVFAADTGTRQDPEGGEAVEVPRERGRDREDEIDAERDHEELLPPEAVGQIAEEQRARAGADEVPRAGRRRLVRRQVQRVLLRQRAGDRADERHLETVEDPCDPEADDDEPVPAAPGEAVEPPRDHRIDGFPRGSKLGCGCRCGHTEKTDACGNRLRLVEPASLVYPPSPGAANAAKVGEHKGEE